MNKRVAWWVVLLFLVGTSAFAQPAVPNHFQIPQRLFASGLYDLKTHEGQAAFVDVVISTLHMRDPNWRHLKKKPGHTEIHGHAEDAALYLLPDGKAQAVDFIVGAGGSAPQPGWGPDRNGPIYKHSDGHDPRDHGLLNKPAPAPQYPPYPNPESTVDGAGETLFADFAASGQDPNPQMFRFAFRVAYDWLTKNVADLNASVTKHRKEWRQLLGLINEPQGPR